MLTTRHKASNCPCCGISLDASTSSIGSIPEVGDLSVCIGCGNILEDGVGLVFGKFDPDRVPSELKESVLTLQKFALSQKFKRESNG